MVVGGLVGRVVRELRRTGSVGDELGPHMCVRVRAVDQWVSPHQPRADAEGQHAARPGAPLRLLPAALVDAAEEHLGPHRRRLRSRLGRRIERGRGPGSGGVGAGAPGRVGLCGRRCCFGGRGGGGRVCCCDGGRQLAAVEAGAAQLQLQPLAACARKSRRNA